MTDSDSIESLVEKMGDVASTIQDIGVDASRLQDTIAIDIQYRPVTDEHRSDIFDLQNRLLKATEDLGKIKRGLDA